MKPSLYNSGKRDANEREILEVLKARNVRYTQMRPGDGCDLIVWIHPMIAVEIKNPEQPESKRELTEDEKELKAYCDETRIGYHVIETAEEMNVIINRYFDRMW